jgi:hypothetical protein
VWEVCRKLTHTCRKLTHTEDTHTEDLSRSPSLINHSFWSGKDLEDCIHFGGTSQRQHEFVPKVNQFFETCGLKSKHGQDRVVLDLMEGLTGGFFVSVGEHSGFYYSNTLLLEKLFDWDGICIETAPKHLWSLSHRKCKLLSTVISDVEDGWVQFENHHHDDMSGIIGGEFKYKVVSTTKEKVFFVVTFDNLSFHLSFTTITMKF